MTKQTQQGEKSVQFLVAEDRAGLEAWPGPGGGACSRQAPGLEAEPGHGWAGPESPPFPPLVLPEHPVKSLLMEKEPQPGLGHATPALGVHWHNPKEVSYRLLAPCVHLSETNVRIPGHDHSVTIERAGAVHQAAAHAQWGQGWKAG